MEMGLGPGDIVLDGDPAPPPQKGGIAPQFLDVRDILCTLEILQGARRLGVKDAILKILSSNVMFII